MHECVVDKINPKFIFSNIMINNDPEFGWSMCHADLEGDPGVDNNNVKLVDCTGLQRGCTCCSATPKGIDNSIDTIVNSMDVFAKYDQNKVDVTRRFQRTGDIPSDRKITHSLTNDGINNNPATKKDVKISINMLGHNKHATQGNTASF